MESGKKKSVKYQVLKKKQNQVFVQLENLIQEMDVKKANKNKIKQYTEHVKCAEQLYTDINRVHKLTQKRSRSATMT